MSHYSWSQIMAASPGEVPIRPPYWDVWPGPLRNYRVYHIFSQALILFRIDWCLLQEAILAQRVYTINLGEEEDFYIDLPVEVGADVEKYCATLGHKINHSFQPNCRSTPTICLLLFLISQLLSVPFVLCAVIQELL